MASVYNRGTKDRPNWYVSYKDSNGKRKCSPTGQPTKKLAEHYRAEVEARIARGIIGIPEPETKPQAVLTVGQLIERFLSEYVGPKVRKLDQYKEHFDAHAITDVSEAIHLPRCLPRRCGPSISRTI
jgi:hypothetical protein